MDIGSKRGVLGEYPSAPTHLHRYGDQFATRATVRKLDTIGMRKWVIAKSIGKRLTYKQLIANSQVG